MKGDKSVMRPVMNTSDNERLNAFGANYYEKPTVALTLLRETIIGKDLFDKAFKEYANRWMYKHPRPADFFRMMEEATAVDLDWFWRGWFFTTDNVDVSVEDVQWYKLASQQPNIENKTKNVKAGDLNAGASGKAVADFSQGPKPFTMLNTPDKAYGEFRSRIDDNTVRQKLEGKNIYEVKFKNNGGLVTPLIIEWTYKDGTKETEYIPAEIWRTNENEASKVFIKDKEVTNVAFDPNAALADVDDSNNIFPKKVADSKFDQFKKNK
jgi:NADH:ubiquinone oxidoreductase subunit